MITEERNGGWRDGWTAKEPAEIGFAWAPDREPEYVDRDLDGFAYSDLGLDGASNGALGVSRFRVEDPSAVGQWRRLDNDLDFLFVIDGHVDVEGADGEVVRLDKYSSAVHPRGHRYRLINPSDDLDAVHVTAPAALLRSAEETGDAEGAPIYTHETEDAYEVGAGPRPWFTYRDLGTDEFTEGRIHLHLVKATGPQEKGTGWHYHTMAQWFMVLGGSAVTAVVGQEDEIPLKFGDSQCLGPGIENSHNATDISGDYKVIELCLPAEYETFAVPAPERATS